MSFVSVLRWLKKEANKPVWGRQLLYCTVQCWHMHNGNLVALAIGRERARDERTMGRRSNRERQLAPVYICQLLRKEAPAPEQQSGAEPRGTRSQPASHSPEERGERSGAERTPQYHTVPETPPGAREREERRLALA